MSENKFSSNTITPLTPSLRRMNGYIFGMSTHGGENLTQDAMSVMLGMFLRKADGGIEKDDGSMMYPFLDAMTDKFEIRCKQHLNNLLDLYDDMKTVNADKEVVTCEVDAKEIYFNNWKIYAYPNSLDNLTYPTPEAREAIISEIRPWNNILGFSYYNVYKYLDWYELFYDVAGIELARVSNDIQETLPDNACSCKYRFILVTDHESCHSAYTLLEDTIAGWLMNNETKTLTIFNKHQANVIYAWMFSLCQRFVDVWKLKQYEGRNHSVGNYYPEMETVLNDKFDGMNIFVEQFNKRCELIESLDNVKYLLDVIVDDGVDSIDPCEVTKDTERLDEFFKNEINIDC